MMALHTVDFKPKSKAAATKVKVISATVEAKTPEDAITFAKQVLLSAPRFEAQVVSTQ